MAILIDNGLSVSRTFVASQAAAAQQHTERTASQQSEDTAARQAERAAAELRRQIQEMLARLEALRRQEELERKRALAAQERAEQARKQAELARLKAERTQKARDEAAYEKAQAAERDKREEAQKAANALDATSKEGELLRAQVAQKREQLESPDGQASTATEQRVQAARTAHDAAVARHTGQPAADAGPGVQPVQNASPAPAGLPLLAKTPYFTPALLDSSGQGAPLLGLPSRTTFASLSQPLDPAAPLVPSSTVQPDAVASPLEQFLQVSPFPVAKDGPGTPAPQADPVTRTIEGIAAGRSIEQIAADRKLTSYQVINEAAQAGVSITTRAPTSDNGDVMTTTLKDGEAEVTYHHDLQHDQIQARATLADDTAPGGERVVEMSRDSSGRIHQQVKDKTSGKTITQIDDHEAGTRTKIVVRDDGTRVETTTEMNAGPVEHTVKRGETFSRIAGDRDLSLQELAALNPQVRNVNAINTGSKLVVAAEPTTVREIAKDGAVLETTVTKDGRKHVEYTTPNGHRITLQGEPPGRPKQRDTVREAIFEKGETLEQVADRLDMTPEKVRELLPQGTVEVTEATSDNGDIQTVRLFDPKTNTMVVERHDHHHGTFKREVIDETRTFKVRQYNPKTEKFEIAQVKGGVGYAQSLADREQAQVGDLAGQISKLNTQIRLARKMGEPATELIDRRKGLEELKERAQLDADVEQGKATEVLVSHQQFTVDELAAKAHQQQSWFKPGSKPHKELGQALNELLDLSDQVDRISQSAASDVTLLEATRDHRLAEQAKDKADTRLDDAFETWKRSWRWSGMSEERIQELEAQGARPPGPSYRNAQEENEAAWRDFEKSQEFHDARGQQSTDGAVPHRDAWLDRNHAADALGQATIALKQATSAKNRADINLREGDVARLIEEKEAWIKANPDDYSERFPKQGEIDAAKDEIANLEVGKLLNGEDIRYQRYLLDLPSSTRHYSKPLESARKTYQEDNAEAHLELANQIETLRNATTMHKLSVSQAYIDQWTGRNPAHKGLLDPIGANSSVRAAERRMSDRDALLESKAGRPLAAALADQDKAERLLRKKNDRDEKAARDDAKAFQDAIDRHSWVRDLATALKDDAGDKALDTARGQQDQLDALEGRLDRGEITLLDYAKQQDALVDGYDRRLVDVRRELQDSDETWGYVDTAVRAVVVAAAGIGTTLATGGNVALGFGAAMAANQLFDTTGDVVAMAKGQDIYADGHSSVLGFGIEAARGRAGWKEAWATAKDELVDTATNAVTMGGVGAAMKTATALSGRYAAAGTLNLGRRAFVGAASGTVAQGVDGTGRIGVDVMDLGLDGKLFTSEGGQRLKTTAITSAVGTVLAPVTGAVSGAVPLNMGHYVAGSTAQFVNDGLGNLAVGQATALLAEGRSMNEGEAIAASVGTLTGTLSNIAGHPDLFGRSQPRPAQATEPPPTAPQSTVPVALSTAQQTAPAAPRTAAPGFDADGVPARPETLGRGRQWQDVAFDRLVNYHRTASAPGSTARPLSPSPNEQAMHQLLRQDPDLQAGSTERFVVSHLAPQDSFLRQVAGNLQPQGIRAKRSNTYGSFEEASDAAQRRGGAWIYRVMPEDTVSAMGRRARVRTEEIMGALHVDRGGNLLPIGVPNVRFTSWDDVAQGHAPRPPVVPPHYLNPPILGTPGLAGQPRTTHQSGQGTSLAPPDVDLDAIIEGTSRFKGARPAYAGAQRLDDVDPSAVASDAERAQTAYLVGASSPDGHAARALGFWQRASSYVRGQAPSMFGAPDYVAKRFVVAEDPAAVLDGDAGTSFTLRRTEVAPGIHRLHVYDSFDEARAAVAGMDGGVVVRLVDTKKQLSESIRQGRATNGQVDGMIIVQRDGTVLPTSIANRNANPHVPREGQVFVDPRAEAPDTNKLYKRWDTFKVYGGAGLLLAGSAALTYGAVRLGGSALGLTYGGAALGGYAAARELFLRHAFHAFLYRGSAAGWKQSVKIRLQKHASPDHENTFVMIKDLADPTKRDAALTQLETQLTSGVARRRGFSDSDRARYRAALQTLRTQPDDETARAVVLQGAYERAGLPVTGRRGQWNRIPPELRSAYADAMQVVRTQPVTPAQTAAWADAAALLATAPYVRRARQYAGHLRGGMFMRNVPREDRARYAEAVNRLAQDPKDAQALRTLQMLNLDTVQRHATGYRGAWRGIHKADRHTIELEAETLRANSESTASQAVIEGAGGKVATANTPVGRSLLGLRIASFAWSNSAGTRLYLDPFLDPNWHLSFSNADSARQAIGQPGTTLFAWANGTGFLASTVAANAAGAKARRGVDVMLTHDAQSIDNQVLKRANEAQGEADPAQKLPFVPVDGNGKPVKTYRNTEGQSLLWRWFKGLGNVESATTKGLDDAGNAKIVPPVVARMPQWSSWGDATGLTFLLTATLVEGGQYAAQGQYGMAAVTLAKLAGGIWAFRGVQQDYQGELHANSGQGAYVYHSRLTTFFNAPLGSARLPTMNWRGKPINTETGGPTPEAGTATTGAKTPARQGETPEAADTGRKNSDAVIRKGLPPMVKLWAGVAIMVGMDEWLKAMKAEQARQGAQPLQGAPTHGVPSGTQTDPLDWLEAMRPALDDGLPAGIAPLPPVPERLPVNAALAQFLNVGPRGQPAVAGLGASFGATGRADRVLGG